MFLKTEPPYGQRLGLRKLERLARAELGGEVRLSDLTGRALTLIAHRAKREGGNNGRPMAHNTVIRGVLNSASVLLKFHLGQFERNRIFADVQFSREEDRREVSLAQDEVRRLLAACRPAWLRVMVTLALASGGERGVLLSLRPRHVKIVLDEMTGWYSGCVLLEGTKTKARRRTVDVADSVCRVLLPQLEGLSAHERIFGGIDAYKVRYWFDQARAEAGLDHLRFHDLRAVFSHAGEEAGIMLTVMQRVMGHAGPDMTRSYQWREAVLGSDGAEKIARQLGLTG